MASAVRLPGIYFQTVPPPARGVLPRMDIAAFAGFSASGPLNIPVAVEDAVRFQEIFGDDLALAWDAARNRTIFAQLPSAVRAFFRNGGRRCWVVRLAGTAETTTFALPGLLRVRGNATEPARVKVRSEGSWADQLGVNATLSQYPIAFTGMTATEVLPGDLVRLLYPSSKTLAFIPVPPPSQTEHGLRRKTRRAVTLDPLGGYWFQAAATGDLPVQQGTVTVAGSAGSYLFQASAGQFAFRVPRADATPFTPGVMVQATLAGALIGTRGATLWIQVSETNSVTGSSGADEVWVVGRAAWWPLDPAAAWAANTAAQPQAAIVTLELWVRQALGGVARLADIGFVPGHSRFVGYLPDDYSLYTPLDQPADNPGAELWPIAAHPRFPLAAPDEAFSAIHLPLGVAGQELDDYYQPATISSLTPLERDGLAALTPDLFLDPDLARSGAATLLDAAFFKRYQQEPNGTLTGFHALLPISEATLLAVPDASQAAWERVTQVRDVLGAPRLDPVPPPDPDGGVTVTWTAVPGAVTYTLEQSAGPLFENVRKSWTVDATVLPIQIDTKECLESLYYRVRANGENGAGPWSNTRREDFPKGQFQRCSAVALEPPSLDSPAEQNGRVTLTWTGPADADNFVLQTAADPDFLLPAQIFSGKLSVFSVWKAGDVLRYYRVRAARGSVTSPWSNTVWTLPAALPAWQILEETTDQQAARLLPIHQALLRMSAARGDLFANLSLPEAWREAEALQYKGTLRSVQTGPDEERALSFGAIYHPWVTVRENEGRPETSLREVPPDGPVTGTFASRSLVDGAWVAPANQKLNGAVALDPPLGPSAASSFYEAQINLLRDDPRGFLVMSAETLSPDSDLRPINVRRLLSLLRMVALREGARLVFEPNDAAFQRRVRRHFEQVLNGLYRRGALAGDTSEQAYRVVADGTLNTQQDLDQGRFIVELRVAPSRPLAFLTVRLVQTGAEILVKEQ